VAYTRRDTPPDRAAKPHSKLQRWTDLIAALLARQYRATFDDLAREVPAYAAGLDPDHKDSVKRTFERDKDELREFGVPIESVAVDEGENTGYRLRATKFYLPYLTVTDIERRPSPSKPPGYRALPKSPLSSTSSSSWHRPSIASRSWATRCLRTTRGPRRSATTHRRNRLAHSAAKGCRRRATSRTP